MVTIHSIVRLLGSRALRLNNTTEHEGNENTQRQKRWEAYFGQLIVIVASPPAVSLRKAAEMIKRLHIGMRISLINIHTHTHTYTYTHTHTYTHTQKHTHINAHACNYLRT
jgi:hypothetical protein